mmetsp:Transcript_14680/g.17870  ORF Transcript_14680/g.17870 Transcript_14680/m.17870 type:complete len:82 (-) Transcript_14680:109-354(-)
MFKSYPDNSPNHSTLIHYCLAQNFVPIERSSMYKLLAKHKNCQHIANYWNARGRKRLLEDDDIAEIVQGLKKQKWFHNWKS